MKACELIVAQRLVKALYGRYLSCSCFVVVSPLLGGEVKILVNVRQSYPCHSRKGYICYYVAVFGGYYIFLDISEKKPQVDIIRFDSFFRTVPYYSQIKNIFSEIRGTVLHIHSHSISPLHCFYIILTYLTLYVKQRVGVSQLLHQCFLEH